MVARTVVHLVVLLALETAAFSSVRAPTTRRRPTSDLHATEKLVFKGDYTCSTDPLPGGVSQADVSAFLEQSATRDIFLSAGGTRTLQELELTPQFKGFWQEACRHFGSDALPTDDDVVFAVDTVVSFPGLLLLVTTAVSGVKKIQGENGLEGYELMLVAQKQTAQGAPPVVWIFNKLTGINKRDEALWYPPSQAKARSTIGITELSGGSVAISFKLELQVTVEFPAVLVKILPSSKEKTEEQGTASILKTVSKDIDKAMEVAFEKFVENKSLLPSDPVSGDGILNA